MNFSFKVCNQSFFQKTLKKSIYMYQYLQYLLLQQNVLILSIFDQHATFYNFLRPLNLNMFTRMNTHIVLLIVKVT